MSVHTVHKENDSKLLSSCVTKLNKCKTFARVLEKKVSSCQQQTKDTQSVPVNLFFITAVAIFIALGYFVFIYIRRRHRRGQADKNTEYRAEVEYLTRQRDEAVLEKNKALLRLSETVSSKLRDGNPNVADLSDENRPTKLSEQLSEIYDNEYTDCMALLLQHDLAETKIVKQLLDILKIVYECCLGASSRQIAFIQQILTSPVTEATDFEIKLRNVEDSTVLPKEFLKRIKDERKAVKPQLSCILDQVMTQIGTKHSTHSDIDNKPVKTYIDRCVKLIWLMTIQDPPMYLEFNEERHENLRAYTRSGPIIDFHVWPSLYLCKGGSLMAKGVAQFKESGGRDRGLNSKKHK